MIDKMQCNGCEMSIFIWISNILVRSFPKWGKQKLSQTKQIHLNAAFDLLHHTIYHMIVERSEDILTLNGTRSRLTKVICGIIQQSLKMWCSIHKPDAEKEEEDGDFDNDEEEVVDMFYEERTGDGNVTFSDKLPHTSS